MPPPTTLRFMLNVTKRPVRWYRRLPATNRFILGLVASPISAAATTAWVTFAPNRGFASSRYDSSSVASNQTSKKHWDSVLVGMM